MLTLNKILHNFNEGKRKDYDLFLVELGQQTVNNNALAQYLKDIKDCINLLEQRHEYLVGVLLAMDWAGRTSEVVEVYHSLMLSLVTAHPVYLKPIIQAQLNRFIKGRPLSEASDLLVSDDVYNGHIHQLLQAIMKLVPLAPQLVVQLLRAPYIGLPVEQHQTFVANALKIYDYIHPQHHNQILKGLFSYLIKLDMEAPRAEIIHMEHSGGLEDSLEATQFPMDAIELNKVMEEKKSFEQRIDKIDSVMSVLFDHVANTCCPGGKMNWDKTRMMYRELLQIFDSVISKTLNLSHVQFLMFYICSLDNRLCEGFIDYLWKRVKNQNLESIYREVAAWYLGSFLARAKFIDIEFALTTLDVMSAWINDYINQSTYSTHFSICQHGPFYSACQSLFYVFAFRHKEILDPQYPKGLQRVHGWKLQAIVTSHLNPLRASMLHIVQLFSEVVRQYQIALCDTVLERNRKNFISMDSSSNRRVTDINNPLNSFFGFDPYVLEKSGDRVTPLIRHAEMLESGQNGDDDDTVHDIQEEDHYKMDDDDKELNEVSLSFSSMDMDFGSPSPRMLNPFLNRTII